MEWVKLSTTYDTDGAIMRAGEPAEVLFTRALAYCGREETGGFIPDGMPSRLCPKGSAARVRALVLEKLWVRDDQRHGWWIRSWEAWQSDLDVLAERRRNERERKRKERERRAQEAKMSRDMSRDSHVTGSDENLVTGRSRPFSVEQKAGPANRTPDAASPAETDFVSRDCPADSPARDREQRLRPKNKTPTTGPYVSQGRNAHDAEPPPSDAPPTIVEQIIAEYRDNSPNGVSSKLASQAAAEVRTLVRDGFHPDKIREGLAQLRPRRLGIGALAAVVDELANSQPSNVIAIRGPARPSSTDRAVAEGLAVVAHFEALEALEAEQARKEINP